MMGVLAMAEPRRYVPPTEEEYEQTVRAAAIGWRLAMGETLTARKVADDYGIGISGAHKILKRIARGLRIYEENHEWRKSPPECPPRT